MSYQTNKKCLTAIIAQRTDDQKCLTKQLLHKGQIIKNVLLDNYYIKADY